MPENWQNFLAKSEFRRPPRNNEIELSVFGRGYGECLVISCGSNEYIVVDSFRNSDTKNPIALDYMEALNLPYSAIKQVILTHWHQDHITGIAEVLQKASPDVKLVISPIIQKQAFLEHIEIRTAEKSENIVEFSQVMEFMKNNLSRIIIPSPNKVIFPYKENGVEVCALSPSDADLLEYIWALTMPDEKRKTSYSAPDDNRLSIVLLLKIGNDGILLGSDLENSRNCDSGWKRLVSNYYQINNRPSLFKIPHHGSLNAHNDDLWTNILNDKPLSVLTVFNKGVKLPTKDDIDRITNLSQSLYIVGANTVRNKQVEKKAKEHLRNVKVSAISTKIGLARFRRDFDKQEWNVEIFGSVAKH